MDISVNFESIRLQQWRYFEFIAAFPISPPFIVARDMTIIIITIDWCPIYGPNCGFFDKWHFRISPVIQS